MEDAQDFDKAGMESRGYGEYVPLPLTHLPPLHIIYADNPGDSGKVHSTVRAHSPEPGSARAPAIRNAAAH
jgi:hypothetical protein